MNENPMRDTQFEDVWAACMLIAGKGDVRVVDAGAEWVAGTNVA